MFLRQTALSRRYYFYGLAFIVYTRILVLWFSKIDKSILIHEFSDKKRNIFPRVRRVRGLINLQRLAKNMLTKQPALHPHMGPEEKK